MPLDEQSRRLTQFVSGNQQYESNKLFYGISIVPAAFSAIMSKIFRPLILKKNAVTYLDDVFMHKNVRSSITVPSIIKERKHESSSRQITFFLNTRKISWTYYREKHYNPIEITHRCNPKTPATHK